MPNLQWESLRLEEQGFAAVRFFGLDPVAESNCPSPAIFGSLLTPFLVDHCNFNQVLDRAMVLNDEIESSHPSV